MRRLLRDQRTVTLATTDKQLIGTNDRRWALVIGCGSPGVSALKAAGAVGSALSGATIGIKLTYTVSAGVQGYLQSVSWVSTAGTPAVLALQLIRSAVTYTLINPLSQGLTQVPMPLLAGDVIQLNVVTLGAGNTFDATINASEDQPSTRATISFTGPATLDNGINLYPGDPPLVLLYDHVGQAIREDIHAIAASGTPTLSVVDIFEEDCGCMVNNELTRADRYNPSPGWK